MLGGAREFLHGLILLRNRHLPLLSYALIELGPVLHRPHLLAHRDRAGANVWPRPVRQGEGRLARNSFRASGHSARAYTSAIFRAAPRVRNRGPMCPRADSEGAGPRSSSRRPTGRTAPLPDRHIRSSWANAGSETRPAPQACSDRA